MYRYPNYLELELANKKTEVAEINKANLRFFDLIKEDFFKDDDRHVKVYRTEDNTAIYMLEKFKNKLNIYHSEIYDFNNEETNEQLLKYDLMAMKQSPKENLNAYLIFGMYTGEKQESLFDAKKLLKKLKKMGKEGESLSKDLLDVLYQKLDQHSSGFKATSEVSSLQEYFNILSNKGLLSNVFDNDFYKSLSVKLNEKVGESLDDFKVKINYLTEISEKQGFILENRYEFNDLDNHIWLDKGKLVVTDQTCGFYFDMKDEKNYNVYFLNHEYGDIEKEIEKIEIKVKENSTDVNGLVLEVKDDKVIFANNAYIGILDLDLGFSCEAFKESGFGVKKSPVDIYSYQYQKDYYFHEYDCNEFNFVAQALLTLGGGFEYDEVSGTLVDSHVKYIKNLNKDTSEPKKIKEFNYCDPKKVSFLNDDWLAGVKYMVKVLKEDRPIPTVHYEETPDKALDKAISYYEGVIKKLEKQKKLKV